MLWKLVLVLVFSFVLSSNQALAASVDPLEVGHWTKIKHRPDDLDLRETYAKWLRWGKPSRGAREHEGDKIRGEYLEIEVQRARLALLNAADSREAAELQRRSEEKQPAALNAWKRHGA